MYRFWKFLRKYFPMSFLLLIQFDFSLIKTILFFLLFIRVHVKKNLEFLSPFLSQNFLDLWVKMVPCLALWMHSFYRFSFYLELWTFCDSFLVCKYLNLLSSSFMRVWVKPNFSLFHNFRVLIMLFRCLKVL